jgi:hypothetical protein
MLSRRSFLVGTAATFATSATPQDLWLERREISYPRKIGIGAWENRHESETPDKGTLAFEERMNFGWYYNWRTSPLFDRTPPSRKVPFVPQVWGKAHVDDPIPGQSSALLGFNEPERLANVSVSQAIHLWPKLQAHGVRLGSPATDFSQAIGVKKWLPRFMDSAAAKGLRVDFVCYHDYTTDKDVEGFRARAHAVYAAYRRPIWITEWGLVDWSRPGCFSLRETAAFARAALLMLDALPFVERHAWFAANRWPTNIKTQLFDVGGNRTIVGDVFYHALQKANYT